MRISDWSSDVCSSDLLGLGIAPSAEPLVSVKLGQSYAEVVRDPVTGAAKADASAAQLLSIDVNDPLGILQELTGQLTGVLDTLAVDQLACSGANPLADVLCLQLGSLPELTVPHLKARGPHQLGSDTSRERVFQ